MCEIIFDRRLLRGERLLWSGVPGPGLRLAPGDAWRIPVSLLWCGVAGFEEVSAVVDPAPWLLALCGAPFVLVGLYLAAGRFLVDAWLRGKTHYAVTDKRILIHRKAPFGSVTLLSRDRLPEPQLIEEAHGRGTIRFGEPAPSLSRRIGLAAWMPALDPVPQLIAIEDAHAVFDELRREIRRAG